MKNCVLPVLCCLLSFVAHAQNRLYDPTLEAQLQFRQSAFPFGVASGDPKAHSVVIWTAVYSSSLKQVEVKYKVALDTLMGMVVKQGIVQTDTSQGNIVKLVIADLKPQTKYYYCFEINEKRSPVGRTQTLPEANAAIANLRVAVVSCANYEWGYFNAYRHLAQQQDIAAVIHLGDYIYEYGPGKYGSKKLMRKHLPAHEILTIGDYRTRYAQYRLDPDLAEMHRLHPVIAVWDDHEYANDAHVAGAGNHDPNTEGDWADRKAIARQAWFEWLPVDLRVDQPIYRSFQFGTLAQLMMLDGRMTGRQPQVSGPADPKRFEASQTMLGQTQLDWLLKSVTQSASTWQLVGNQTIVSTLKVPKMFQGKAKTSMDMWDGYPTERDKMLQQLLDQQKQVLVFTGDAHVSIDFDLRVDRRKKATRVGREWVTPSISSANLDEYLSKPSASFFQFGMRHAPGNPHLRYADIKNHGYLLVELTPQTATAQWVHMQSVLTTSLSTKRGHKTVVRKK